MTDKILRSGLPHDNIPTRMRSTGAGDFLHGVDPLGQPAVARKLSAGAASANTALTTTARRISMMARNANMRYAIGAVAQTATADSHYIAQGERLDVSVPAGAHIAVIRADSTDGVLEVSELA